MKAGVFHGPGDLRVEDRPIPPVGRDEVLIKVAYRGICGSDVHTFNGMQSNVHRRAPGPRLLGHEVSGVVTEVGADVTMCRPGDEITCIPWVTCGQCPYCRRGLPNHCPSKRLVGGTFAEYAVAPEGAIYHLPVGVSLRRAALSEPVSCCVWAIDLGQIESRSTTCVVGAGAMGLIVSLLAGSGGASDVIVSEPNPLRRELASKIGATATIDPREQDLEAFVRQRTEGLGADVAFEVVGHPATVQDALRVVRNGGTVVIVGVADPAATIPLSPYEVYRRELTIRGCFTRRLSFDRAVRWLPALDLDPIITHVFPLADLSEAMEHARLGKAGKVLVAP